LIKPLEEHSSLVIAYRHNNKVLSDKPFVAVLWVSQASGKKSTLDAFYSKRLAERVAIHHVHDSSDTKHVIGGSLKTFFINLLFLPNVAA